MVEPLKYILAIEVNMEDWWECVFTFLEAPIDFRELEALVKEVISPCNFTMSTKRNERWI